MWAAEMCACVPVCMFFGFVANRVNVRCYAPTQCLLARSDARTRLQTLLFSASFECLEPSYPNALRAKNFTDQIIDRAVKEPVVIRVASMEGLRLENVTHFVVRVRRGGRGVCAGGCAFRALAVACLFIFASALPLRIIRCTALSTYVS